ncbi:MAG TPA: hypothetical protein VH761_02255 [Ilumatobacteraceae bacterium]|jgi:hypothetical protein
MVIQHTAERLRKRQMMTRVWAAVVIAWSIIRTIIIWAALGDYGFNPWIYLCIDLVCSTIDAVTTPRMVLGFIDDRYRLAMKWGVVSLVAYVVPDVYIFVGTRTLPLKVIVILCTIITAMLCLAVLTVTRKVRAGRAARAHLAAAAAAVAGRA